MRLLSDCEATGSSVRKHHRPLDKSSAVRFFPTRRWTNRAAGSDLHDAPHRLAFTFEAFTLSDDLMQTGRWCMRCCETLLSDQLRVEGCKEMLDLSSAAASSWKEFLPPTENPAPPEDPEPPHPVQAGGPRCHGNSSPWSLPTPPPYSNPLSDIKLPSEWRRLRRSLRRSRQMSPMASSAVHVTSLQPGHIYHRDDSLRRLQALKWTPVAPGLGLALVAPPASCSPLPEVWLVHIQSDPPTSSQCSPASRTLFQGPCPEHVLYLRVELWSSSSLPFPSFVLSCLAALLFYSHLIWLADLCRLASPAAFLIVFRNSSCLRFHFISSCFLDLLLVFSDYFGLLCVEPITVRGEAVSNS